MKKTADNSHIFQIRFFSSRNRMDDYCSTRQHKTSCQKQKKTQTSLCGVSPFRNDIAAPATAIAMTAANMPIPVHRSQPF
jgi:hypothetical protein